ncbi:DNA polymerase delta catalytic subunit-like, partial [Limulus polyphemus]|uniref:DNA polymerase delta catalytic subunit n=1 Tax=Limulus polyphemus TaxID=6850 RepID=A0ABM1BY41_LIMPO
MNGKRKSFPGRFQSSQSNKRSRRDDDNEPLDFEAELALMDSVEEEIQLESQGEGPENLSTSSKWSRPTPPPLNPEKDSLVFQQLDIAHYIGQPLAGMPGSQIGSVPVMQMFGITMEGYSVMCHVHGFTPYFFIPAPTNFKTEHCQIFQEVLNKAVIADMRSNKDGITQAVLAVGVVIKESIYGYHVNRKVPFLKITMALPRLIAPAKRLLETGVVNVPSYGSRAYQPYESNIDFEIRFMVDTGIVGCSWIELPPKKYQVRSKDNAPSPISRCQIEVDVAWDSFISYPPEGEWAKVAPFRILSFDIECAGRKGIFPEPEKDPVIQIANMVIRQGEKDPFIRNVFTLNSCAPIVGSQVLSYMKENQMLEKWADFVREVDPDIITGYNIQNFDITYLINRAKTLNVKPFPFLGRVINRASVIKNSMIQSKQMGRRENKFINTEGRIQFDLLL